MNGNPTLYPGPSAACRIRGTGILPALLLIIHLTGSVFGAVTEKQQPPQGLPSANSQAVLEPVFLVPPGIRFGPEQDGTGGVRFSSGIPSSVYINETFVPCFQFTNTSLSKLLMVEITQSDGTRVTYNIASRPAGTYTVCLPDKYAFGSCGSQWIQIRGYWEQVVYCITYPCYPINQWDSGDKRTMWVNCESVAPVPFITGTQPSSFTAGDPGFFLTINGGNFVNRSTVQWNGLNRPTTFINSTQLQATIYASDIAIAGTVRIGVYTSPPGGGTVEVTGVNNNPVPVFSTLEPSSVMAGSPGFTLNIRGTGFNSKSIVQWQGSTRPLTSVSSSMLGVAIQAGDVASPGSAVVSVTNPTPGGGSFQATFLIQAGSTTTTTTTTLGSTTTTLASGPVIRLNNSRFEVSVKWVNYNDASTGSGTGVAYTKDSGYFWFTDPNNIELMIKVLDGRQINGNFWVMYGALSDQQYTITIKDTVTGTVKTYFNPAYKLDSFSDIDAFSGSQAAAASRPQPLGAEYGRLATQRWIQLLGRRNPADFSMPPPQRLKSSAAGCSTVGSQLCLNSNRFLLTLNWRNYNDGSTGYAQAVSLTPDTGYFWFTDPNNIELVVKVLDGRALNGHFWIMYGSLTNLEYTITLTDTQTGEIKSYHNPPYKQQSGKDIEAMH